MDEESGESMEPMEEVPPKEPGEKESGAPRGILDDTDCVFRISVGNLRMLLVEYVGLLKTNSFVNVPLQLLSPEALFSPKCTKYRLVAGLRLDPLGELNSAPPDPLAGFKGAYF